MTSHISSDKANSTQQDTEVSVVPTGSLSMILFETRRLFSESSNFQSMTSTSNSSDAANSIHIVAPDHSGGDEDSVEDNFKYPYVSLNIRDCSWSLKSSGPVPVFAPKQGVVAYIEVENAAENINKSSDTALLFMNSIGLIIEDFCSSTQGDGGIQLLYIECEQPQRNQESRLGKMGDFYSIEIHMQFGYR